MSPDYHPCFIDNRASRRLNNFTKLHCLQLEKQGYKSLKQTTFSFQPNF